MAEGKKCVLFYVDWGSTFDELDDEEAGRLIKHFANYIRDKNPEAPDKLTKIAFEPIKNQLKRDLIKWESEKDQKSQNGIMGNLKRWHLDLYNLVLEKKIDINEAINIAESRKTSLPDPPGSQDIANIAVTVTVDDTVDVTDTVNVEVKNNKEVSEKKTVSKKPDPLEKAKEIARVSFVDEKCSFGNDFKKVWLSLIQQGKWKSKSQTAINLSLRKLMKYDEVFAIVLVENSISGNYQGVVFPETDAQYQKFLNQKNGNSKESAKESRDRMVELATAILTNGKA